MFDKGYSHYIYCRTFLINHMSDKDKKPIDEPNSLEQDKREILAKEIGKRLQDARTGLAWSQETLHKRTVMIDPEKVGISRAVLSIYERGVSKPGAREIKLLCEALKITPNWLLYGSDSPARTLQASMDFLQGNEINMSTRLALAMMVLEPVQRDHFAGLLLSIVNQKLGDIQLSGLMSVAGTMSESFYKDVFDYYGDNHKDITIKEVISKFISREAGGSFTNKGHLRPIDVDDDNFDPFDPENPLPPARKLDGQD